MKISLLVVAMALLYTTGVTAAEVCPKQKRATATASDCYKTQSGKKVACKRTKL